MKRKNFLSEKDLRLFLKRFLKEKLKGLPPDFKIEIRVFSHQPPRTALKIPAHSEKNLLRAHQVDLLIRELSEAGITVEVFYLDDEPEASESLSFNPSEKPNQGKAQFP
ncbi:hypothetical protein [Thermosulfurimonas dismutans]|uniref:hypothetical protein n=1 Tax=Thermosulfurimonas dismutans TaxID=999894 RepID=UPI00129482F3|nr:hypothetical protein [Thermosulfurimonas dismutans]